MEHREEKPTWSGDDSRSQQGQAVLVPISSDTAKPQEVHCLLILRLSSAPNPHPLPSVSDYHHQLV